MEYAQKELLLGEINELEEAAVNGVIDIIKLAESIEDDSEIDLGELQSSTMWKVRVGFDPRAYILYQQHLFLAVSSWLRHSISANQVCVALL